MKAFTILFALIGLLALGSALFASATHQFFTTVICTIMVLTGIADIRKVKKNSHDRTIKNSL